VGINHPVSILADVVARSGRLTRRVAGTVLLAISMFTVVGCGSSSSNTNNGNRSGAKPSKASFCADNAKLDKSTNSATDRTELLKDLRANQATISNFGQTAPTAIRSKAQVLVSGAEKAIQSGDTSAINQQFGNAGTAVDKYCGQS